MTIRVISVVVPLVAAFVFFVAARWHYRKETSVDRELGVLSLVLSLTCLVLAGFAYLK